MPNSNATKKTQVVLSLHAPSSPPPHVSEHHSMNTTDRVFECSCFDYLLQVAYDCSAQLFAFKLYCPVHFLCFCEKAFSIGSKNTPHCPKCIIFIQLILPFNPTWESDQLMFFSRFLIPSEWPYQVKTVTFLLQLCNMQADPRLWCLGTLSTVTSETTPN